VFQTRLHVTTRQMTWMWKIRVIRYAEWPVNQVAGMRSYWPGKHLAIVPDYVCLPNKSVVGTKQNDINYFWYSWIRAS